MKVSNRNFYLICLLAILFTFVCGDAYAGDVFGAIKGKAWKVVSGVRRIAMLIAAFGLIGFAFGAIFGKISWKWFANIAIGLFLVANVGLFIDYFATRSGNKGQYAALGYGNYIDNSSNSGGTSGGYSQTPGTNETPSSQTSGTNGGSSGQSSSGQLSGGGCQPGTGVGCSGSGSGGSSSTTGNSSGKSNSSTSGSSSSSNASSSNSSSKNASSSTNSSAQKSSNTSSSSSTNKSTSSSSKKTGPSYVDAGLKGTEKMEGVGLSKADTSISGEVPSLNVGDIMNNIGASAGDK